MYDKNPPENGGFVSNLGRPHGVAPTNIRFIHNLFIYSKTCIIFSMALTSVPHLKCKIQNAECGM